MTTVTADSIRGAMACVAAAVAATLTPVRELPHGLGYYVAAGAVVVGARFGVRAVAMLAAACLAVAVAETARRSCGSAAGCGFEAAAPLLIFGSFLLPTVAGVALGALARLGGRAAAGHELIPSPQQAVTLEPVRTVVVAAIAAATAFVATSILPLAQGRPLVAVLAAAVGLALAPSYGQDRVLVIGWSDSSRASG